jgi:RNA polymerase sigma-70 factor (ECF subfamily)
MPVTETVMSEETHALLARWRDQNDERAAEELFQRYVARLIALVRQRISRRLGRRLDAEDVVLSAWCSFFVRVRDGRIEVQPGNDLWQLLATITLHKMGRHLERHTADKRSIQREEERGQDDSLCLVPVEAVAHDPAPEEELALQEELELSLAPLSPTHRQIVELRLAGCTQPEIAHQVGRTERLVRLVLTEFARSFQHRLQALVDS